MELKVGDTRVRRSGTENPFKIVFIGENRAFCRYLKKPDHHYEEFADCLSYIRDYTVPYQEPKPARTLKAFEHGNGTLVLRYCDKTNDLDHSSNYRKLSDQELKELIKGVVGE